MRAYPCNSPEAAGRLLALTMLADDRACPLEFAVLQALDAPRTLGLDPQALTRLVQDLRDDLMLGDWQGGSLLDRIDERVLAQLMAEVDDPVLQAQLLRLAQAAAEADGQVAAGEALVLGAARRYWGHGQAWSAPPVAPAGRLAAPAAEPAG
jgi:hypothetical protein